MMGDAGEDPPEQAVPGLLRTPRQDGQESPGLGWLAPAGTRPDDELSPAGVLSASGPPPATAFPAAPSATGPSATGLSTTGLSTTGLSTTGLSTTGRLPPGCPPPGCPPPGRPPPGCPPPGRRPPGPSRPGQPGRAAPGRQPGGLRRHRWAAHLILLAGYLAAGLAVTWPRVTYLAGRLPATRDAGGYVWDFWWVARQLSRGASPWSTHYLAAPVGSDLGFHTLMPLPGAVMTPVTLAFGPSASYNLLSILCPGLLCYLMYRAARLWLPTELGAIAAGAFFGLSPILAWRSFFEINLALGALFLPLALEAAVRLRRGGRPGQAVILGAVLGAAVLTDQESAVLAGIVTVVVLVPWLARRPSPARFGSAALAAAAALAVASLQIIPMIAQAGTDKVPPTRAGLLDVNYVNSGAALGQLFAPSPKVAHYGLTAISRYYYHGPHSMVIVTFGVVLTALALLGAGAAWRRGHTRTLVLLWAACAALSLGSALWIGNHRYVPVAEAVHGIRLSMIMPFTWFVRIPGLSTFREANRFTELGLLPAALLAGAAVEFLRRRARLALVPVVVLAALEAGWSGNPGIGAMPTAMPELDGPIAAQHTNSIVVDLPFGIRGGLPVTGDGFPPESMVLATADGHPLADAFISRIPARTLQRHRSPAVLCRAAQRGGRCARDQPGGVHRGGPERPPPAHRLGAALADGHQSHVGVPEAGAGAPAHRIPPGLLGRQGDGVPPVGRPKPAAGGQRTWLNAGAAPADRTRSRIRPTGQGPPPRGRPVPRWPGRGSGRAARWPGRPARRPTGRPGSGPGGTARSATPGRPPRRLRG